MFHLNLAHVLMHVSFEPCDQRCMYLAEYMQPLRTPEASGYKLPVALINPHEHDQYSDPDAVLPIPGPSRPEFGGVVPSDFQGCDCVTSNAWET